MRRGGHSAVAAAAVWAAVSSIAASVVVAPAARAQDFTVGGASAGAESVSLTATQGGTGTIGFTFGVTSASYRDSYASSAAKPLDLGLLTVLFGEGSRCIGETGPVALPAASLPAAFEANSLQGAGGGSAEGESSYPGLYGATPSGPVGRGTAAAAAAPSARASTTIPVVDVGLVSVANPVSETEVKVDAGTRVAVAESRADKLVLLGGVVTLDHPVWRAEARSGSSEVTKATFTTKGGTLFGQPRTAAESVRDLRGWADLIRNLVGFVGIRLDVPTASVEDGVAEISPLRLGVADSPLGAAVVAPLMSLQLPQGDTIEALLQRELDRASAETCNNKRLAQIIVLVLQVLRGVGTAAISVGGASATTDDTPPPPPVTFAPPATDAPPSTSAASDRSGSGSGFGPVGSAFGSGGIGSGIGSGGSDGPSFAPIDPSTTNVAMTPDEIVDDDVIQFASSAVRPTVKVPGRTGGPATPIGIALTTAAAMAVGAERWAQRRRRRRML